MKLPKIIIQDITKHIKNQREAKQKNIMVANGLQNIKVV
jgi:hypothetical protein